MSPDILAKPSTRATLLLTLALGIGIGAGIGGFVAAVHWWSGRLRPWNSSSIRAVATGTSAYLDDEGVPISTRLTLSLTNTTSRDYRLARTEETETMLRTGNALHPAQGAKLETPLFIPAGETVAVHLDIPAGPLMDVLLEARKQAVKPMPPEPNGHDQPVVNAFLPDGVIPPSITSIAIFDRTHRYVINVKKAW